MEGSFLIIAVYIAYMVYNIVRRRRNRAGSPRPPQRVFDRMRENGDPQGRPSPEIRRMEELTESSARSAMIPSRGERATEDAAERAQAAPSADVSGGQFARRRQRPDAGEAGQNRPSDYLGRLRHLRRPGQAVSPAQADSQVPDAGAPLTQSRSPEPGRVMDGASASPYMAEEMVLDYTETKIGGEGEGDHFADSFSAGSASKEYISKETLTQGVLWSQILGQPRARRPARGPRRGRVQGGRQ